MAARTRFAQPNRVSSAAISALEAPERDLVEASGERIPTVAIRRAPDAELNKFVPIGTRKAAQLTMTVDGAEADLRPGPGKLTRRSYRIELSLADAHYTFTPDADDDMRLARGGNDLASFSMTDDGEFEVHWRAEHSQPADAAIGYALSAAFRTRTTGIFSLLLNGSESVPW